MLFFWNIFQVCTPGVIPLGEVGVSPNNVSTLSRTTSCQRRGKKYFRKGKRDFILKIYCRGFLTSFIL